MNTVEYAAIIKEFNLPSSSRVLMIGGMLHHYGLDGYDPYECDLLVCGNGDPIEVGKTYLVKTYDLCVSEIKQVRCTWYISGYDEDGDFLEDVSVNEFSKLAEVQF
ncbi:hypothetical protein [Cylindrospermum sp. FACHB-282]|uniref:hypothetical protein n=1 Tax=Cylindrospermum sp. FACHB-282 TaxID=2692794 RepID=UPI001681C626|nr:hypothetical protein [Cylindrospermum sp. FACHB-282]MBD2386007.1 hypothetical protein [Cylindrospermum sp. FACHB-282]